jgi:hypothetical protein
MRVGMGKIGKGKVFRGPAYRRNGGNDVNLNFRIFYFRPVPGGGIFPRKDHDGF